MVKTVTAWGRNGLQDWLLQRLTAVVLMLAWLAVLGYYSFCHPTQQDWQALWHCASMRYIGLIVLMSLMVHTWIGIWTVTTDYLKSTSVRLIVQILVIVVLGKELRWGFEILWQV